MTDFSQMLKCGCCAAGEMGVKGLSKNVIKPAWRAGKLSDLQAGTTVGVDAMGWIHKAVVSVGLG